jgi:hypothetical protein
MFRSAYFADYTPKQSVTLSALLHILALTALLSFAIFRRERSLESASESGIIPSNILLYEAQPASRHQPDCQATGHARVMKNGYDNKGGACYFTKLKKMYTYPCRRISPCPQCCAKGFKI